MITMTRHNRRTFWLALIAAVLITTICAALAHQFFPWAVVS